MPAAHAHQPVLGVVLAGGLARRMGGADKPLLPLGGRTLLSCVVERLRPQCDELILNGNGAQDRFEGTSLPIVPDSIPGFPGPLAGILAAMEWAATFRPALRWVASVPCDTPFLPHDLVNRLQEAQATSGKPIVCAASGDRIHHAIALWPTDLRRDLRETLVQNGAQSIRGWAASHGVVHVTWPSRPVDPFFNINTSADLAAAQAMVEHASAGF
ncbi:molybdenum cofactor guanylyltransferase [Microvirga subterranea]|uniref:Molybdenum cofactor guanylyltransferase n=1 Tax=Microvirga subterranea TaxID=186651 RepID=A0A370HL08_9HYPH|nr:molybdenum cofactor guanylyltransferase MobA [Microvirga subterranea]RDI59286.1 molybdenum cofactor guanylyltransferase [Microvirga subterranea]